AVVRPDRLLVRIAQPVDPRDHLAHRGRVRRVFLDPLAAWRLDGHEADLPAELRPPLEEGLEGEEAAQDVLRRLDPVGADDEARRARPGEPLAQVRELPLDGRRPRHAGEPYRVDGDGIRPDPDPATSPVDVPRVAVAAR